MHILAELTPLDPASGARVTLRACSSDDRAITALGGERWWPAIHEMPSLGIKLFDGDFSSNVDPGGASFTVLIDKLARIDPDARLYRWGGAKVKLYSGESGDAWPWPTAFEGLLERFEQQANRLKIQARVDTEPFEKPVLTLAYAGTGGAEGGADLKNKVKPWVLGRAANVEPLLIDATNSVFQFSAYGPIEAVTALYERGSDFGASVGNFASYAALVAAAIPRGRWGTCLAEGLVRLGAPPFGVITGDVDGDKPGGVWIRNTGAIISRMATNAGVASSLIDSASLAALDLAVPYNINLVLTDQTSVLDIARRLARPCNAQAGISWTGKLFVCRVAIGTPVITLDAQGRRRPGVLSSVESDVSPPYWRIEMGAKRSWKVHSPDEIAFAAALVDRGLYAAGETYREGNIVDLANGSRWLYINPSPTSGNAPPATGTSNAWWSRLRAPLTTADIAGLTAALNTLTADIGGLEAAVDGKVTIYRQSTIPVADGARDLWFRTSTGKWYQAAAAGSNEIKAGEWELTEDSSIGTAILAAAGAQATADGKVETFYQDAEPAPGALGDLWIRPSDTPKVVKRWDGADWVAMTPASLAELDALAAAELAAATNRLDTADNDGVISRGEKPQVAMDVGELVAQAKAQITRGERLGLLPASAQMLNTTSSWGGFGLANVTKAGAGVAPAERLVPGEAFRFTAPAGALLKRVNNTTGDQAVTAGGYVLMGVTAKWENGDRYLVMQPGRGGVVTFDMADGQLTGLDHNTVDAYSVNLGDGWFEFWVKYRANGTGTSTWSLYLSDTVNEESASAASMGGSWLMFSPIHAVVAETTWWMHYMDREAFGGPTTRASTSASADALVGHISHYLYGLGTSGGYWTVTDHDTLVVAGDNLISTPYDFGGFSAFCTLTPSGIAAIVEDTPTDSVGFIRQIRTFTEPGAYVAGVRVAKSATAQGRRLFLSDNNAVGQSCLFDASTGQHIGGTVVDCGGHWMVLVEATLSGQAHIRWHYYPAYNTVLSAAANSGATGSDLIWQPILYRGTIRSLRAMLTARLNAAKKALQMLRNAVNQVDGTTALQISGESALTIKASHLGVVEGGQLPKNISYKALVGLGEVTTAAAWSRTVISGSVTCTIGAATGVFGITALGSVEAVVEITCVYAGVTQKTRLTITRADAAPPVSGGSGGDGGGGGGEPPAGTSASDTSFSGFSSTTMAVISDELNVTAGSTSVALSAGLSISSNLATFGTFEAMAVFQWWNGTAWENVGTETASSPDHTRYDEGGGDYRTGEYGSISISTSKTGLTAASNYKFRLLARRALSSPAGTLFASGSATATG